MNERSIFLAALDIADPAQRLAYLNQVCGDDHKLRAHIDELIAAQGKLGGFLAQPHSAAEATADFASAAEHPGTAKENPIATCLARLLSANGIYP